MTAPRCPWEAAVTHCVRLRRSREPRPPVNASPKPSLRKEMEFSGLSVLSSVFTLSITTITSPKQYGTWIMCFVFMKSVDENRKHAYTHLETSQAAPVLRLRNNRGCFET